MPDLACEIKLLGAELRAAIAAAVAASEERMRDYIDTRFNELERRLTARIEALEQGQRWVIGLLIAILLGTAGGLAGAITILGRVWERLA